MATIDDFDFATGDAGASYTTNTEAGQIRVGGFLVMKERPAKVTAVSTSKTGKHGSAKCNITGVDIFNGKKYEDIAPSTSTVQVPNLTRTEYSLVDINEEGYLTLMGADGTCREDIQLPEWPENYGREIRTAFETGKNYLATVWSAMGHDQVMQIKEDVDAPPKDSK